MALYSVTLKASDATDVTAEFELELGSNYTLQAQGGVVSITEQVDVPDPTGNAHMVLLINEFFPFQQGEDKLYAWGDADLVVIDAV